VFDNRVLRIISGPKTEEIKDAGGNSIMISVIMIAS
jgi:hypothetical protein